jgi:predicted ferric reductase
MNNLSWSNDLEEEKNNLIQVIILPFGVILGLLLLFLLLPSILPGLASSLLSSAPKAFWYLSRATAICSYLILWVSMLLGVAMTGKLAQKSSTKVGIFEMHKFTSIMGLFFAAFHALILLGDQFLHFTLADIFIPFSTTFYRPLWVGLGQIGFYLWIIIVLSYYVRKQLSRKGWRLVHFLSFACFLFALIHGITSGTDASLVGMQLVYLTSGGILTTLILYRMLAPVIKDKTDPIRQSN